jgi:hypothetical protein
MEVTCPAPNISHASVATPQPSYVYNDTAVILCDVGHVFMTSVPDNNTYLMFRDVAVPAINVTCNGSGHWTLETVYCQPADCGEEPSIPYAKLLSHGQPTTYDHAASYKCVDGYWFSRQILEANINCSASGTWNQTSDKRTFDGTPISYHQCTLVTCEALMNHLPSDAPNSPGSLVNVSCEAGKKLANNKPWLETMCEASGVWNPAIPDCIALVPVVKVILPVQEAKKADVVAGVAAGFLAVGALLLVVFDARSLKSSFQLLCKNVHGICSSGQR